MDTSERFPRGVNMRITLEDLKKDSEFRALPYSDQFIGIAKVIRSDLDHAQVVDNGEGISNLTHHLKDIEVAIDTHLKSCSLEDSKKINKYREDIKGDSVMLLKIRYRLMKLMPSLFGIPTYVVNENRYVNKAGVRCLTSEMFYKKDALNMLVDVTIRTKKTRESFKATIILDDKRYTFSVSEQHWSIHELTEWGSDVKIKAEYTQSSEEIKPLPKWATGIVTSIWFGYTVTDSDREDIWEWLNSGLIKAKEDKDDRTN